VSDFDPAAYHARLKAHDWWYEYSDMAGVREKGERESREIVKIADSSPAACVMFDAWVDYVGGHRPEPKLEEFVHG